MSASSLPHLPTPPLVSPSVDSTGLEELVLAHAWHYKPTERLPSDSPELLLLDGAEPPPEGEALCAKLELTHRDRLTLATILPPQSSECKASPTCGAHCLVIDGMLCVTPQPHVLSAAP